WAPPNPASTGPPAASGRASPSRRPSTDEERRSPRLRRAHRGSASSAPFGDPSPAGGRSDGPLGFLPAGAVRGRGGRASAGHGLGLLRADPWLAEAAGSRRREPVADGPTHRA